ncbi:MAG: hypothetical protein BAJALOKI2v1_70087 [Promethearchaeota archaeon]|nr:MAG: hypothetical protein BAJALOKI2v1_70087 [Candidatus Lokiarchaeota archaeon]
MDYALMFNVKPGGVSEPIKWGKDQLQPDRSIIVLDESTLSLYLWHGQQQGLVQRRTALRQAQSLKGHGYTVGKSIIGRDIKTIKEIDARKVGKVPEADELYSDLEKVLDKPVKELEDNIVTFDVEEAEGKISKKVGATAKPKPKPKPTPQAKAQPKAKPSEPEPKPKPKPKTEPKVETQEKPKRKVELEPIKKASDEKEGSKGLIVEARVGFVLKAVLDHYSDIWVSKKDDGSYAIEMMEGPICKFEIDKSTAKLKFSQNSFSGISTNIKTAIQKKYIELSKLLK